MMTDPISDMLSRIRNASMVRKPHVLIPYSKLKFVIAELLSQQGFVGKVEKNEDPKGRPMLLISLLYQKGVARISEITRVSKPGLRVYVKVREIPTVCNAYGLAIMSTPRGIITGENAKQQGIGGELLCTIT